MIDMYTCNGLQGSDIWKTASQIKDPGEARSLLQDCFWPHRLDIHGDRENFCFHHNRTHISNIYIHAIKYGCEVTTNVVVPDHDSYIFVTTLNGRLNYQEQGETIKLSPGTIYVMNPGTISRSVLSSDHVQLTLKIDRTIFRRYLDNEFSTDSSRSLVFSNKAVDLNSDSPGLVFALKRIIASAGLLSSHSIHPSLLCHLENVVTGALLTEIPNNYSEMIAGSALQGPLPKYVARAEEYIHAHPEEVITTTSLAASVNVSCRALQKGFKDKLGVTPMQYLRNFRLDLARQALLCAEPGSIKVTDIACRSGFSDPGAFTRHYRARFHEKPSDTLRYHGWRPHSGKLWISRP